MSLLWRVIRIATRIKEILPAVYRVSQGSIADHIGIREGDRIVSINGSSFADLIDYKFLISDDLLDIVIRRGEKQWVETIEKDPDTDLGIEFEDAVFDGIRRCRNKCVFCFVDQLPQGMRASLHVKDDDYRLSVLCGNFVTLTNMARRDIERIAKLHLSPLYISVHTTEPELRSKMLGNAKAGQIMEQLRMLADAHIDMHTQIVLCPGLNDGEHLARTIRDLSAFWPHVRSIGIVPVGLTDFRDGLFELRHFTDTEARSIVKEVEQWQEHFLKEYGYPLVFLADEFYLLAGMEMPSAGSYGGFPQLENGIGITREFLDELEEARQYLPESLETKLSLTLITGVLGEFAVTHLVSALNEVENVEANLIVVKNLTFGDNITVTGLVTGTSIAEGTRNANLGNVLVIPRVMLKYDEDVFLDGMTVSDLEQTLCRKVLVVDGPKDLVSRLRNKERGLL